MNNVIVEHIWQYPEPAPFDQTGRAIRADAVTAARTVTITNETVVRDYQKSGFEARSLGAQMTMNVSGSTAGPPHPLRGFIAQNAVSYVGASGTIAGNTIIGSGDQYGPARVDGNGTAVLLSGANNVTVDSNTITGVNTDIGVSVSASSTDNITISNNEIGRTVPMLSRPPGIGIDVDHPTSSATLICNTFSGWITNIAGAVQISCEPLPAGTECETYSADVLSVEGGTAPFTWSVAEGTLPPGLTMAPDTGAITGTPTAAGTYNFTVQVADSSEPSLTATQPQTITIAPGCVTTTTAPPTTAPPTTAPPTTAPPTTAPPATAPPTTTAAHQRRRVAGHQGRRPHRGHGEPVEQRDDPAHLHDRSDQRRPRDGDRRRRHRHAAGRGRARVGGPDGRHLHSRRRHPDVPAGHDGGWRD